MSILLIEADPFIVAGKRLPGERVAYVSLLTYGRARLHAAFEWDRFGCYDAW